MTNWELARYLIDAKKCVDSVMYIARNKRALANIGISEKIKLLQRDFYINCCYVLDAVYSTKTAKKELAQKNDLIHEVYYERDKDKAHKDANYQKQKFSSLTELSFIMKKQLHEIKTVCQSALPTEITLDFVPHNRELFRFVHSITPEREEQIKCAKHSQYSKNIGAKGSDELIIKNFHDTEDLREIPPGDLKKYGVVIEVGINTYEGLQNRQDFCIRANVLFKKNMWCTINAEALQETLRLQSIGFLDEFEIVHLPEDMLQND